MAPRRDTGPGRRAALGALALAAALPCCASLPPPAPPTTAEPATKAQTRVAPPASPAPAPGAAEREQLFRRLAALLRPEGLAPDYRAALQELEAHLALRPEDRDEPAITSLAVLLREVDRLDGEIRVGQVRAKAQAETIQGLQQQTVRLERAGGDARAEIERLTAENKKLKATVERLQALEMIMEEKRKRVR